MRRLLTDIAVAARVEARKSAYRIPALVLTIWMAGLLTGPIFDEALQVSEGWAFPVVADMQIDKTIEEDGATVFWGSFEKIRTCDYHHVEWWMRSGNVSVRLPLDVREGPKARGEGRAEFGPWRLPISRDTLMHQSWAEVYHRCHFGWLTITAFWPTVVYPQ